MNFDETLEEYRKTRESLRNLQAGIQKKKNEAIELNKEMDNLVRDYNTKRAFLIDTQARLVPLLHAEVASHPILEREKAEKVPRPVEMNGK